MDATAVEKQLLVKLTEECGEVVQAACKAVNHGLHPYWRGVQYDNVQDVERELGDLLAVRDWLLRTGTLDARSIDHYRQLKFAKLPGALGWAAPDPCESEPYVQGVWVL